MELHKYNIKTNYFAFALIASLFFLWGMANNMNDTLLAAFKSIMSMSDLQSSLVQFAFYGAYFCFALPAAIFISKHSYKSGIILGLSLYACGTFLFYPAGNMSSYPFFLFAIYVMAAGCAILETTANPYILSLGASDNATRRLNIAQTLNPLGAIAGIFISRHFILSELNTASATERSKMSEYALDAVMHQELNSVSETYVYIGFALIAILLVILCVRMPAGQDNTHKMNLGKAFSHLWKTPMWRYGAVAQFFYVGVQTGVWSFNIRLAMRELGLMENAASLIFLYSIIAFTLFRFIFTWIMKYIRPERLLIFASIAAIVSTVGVILTNGLTSVVFLILISAWMSLMFPTIYGIALERLEGEEAKIGASGLIMAILGGALITPLQGWISDISCVSNSFIVPLACFAVVLTYAIYATNNASYHVN